MNPQFGTNDLCSVEEYLQNKDTLLTHVQTTGTNFTLVELQPVFSERRPARFSNLAGPETNSGRSELSALTDSCLETHSGIRGCGSSVKRALDLSIALLLLAMLAPLMALIGLLIWLDAPGPIVYSSERIGKHGRPFYCYKFRTMVINADRLKQHLGALNERDSILFKMANDPRVTRIGRFLRKYSLDELPQLLNVVSGDMSLVGPRPPLLCEVERYKPEDFLRLSVLPGLTGLWQVESRTSTSFDDYIRLDTAYVKNWSLWLDMRILWRTVWVVFAGTGS